MDDLTPYFPQLRAQCAPLGAQLRRVGAATESLFGLAGLFGAYCQARSALALPWLQTLFAALSRRFEPRTQGSWYGRLVRLIDATGFSMPDTKANRRRWPYAGGQKPGCGFPTGKLVGLFCLHTGRLLAFVEGSWKNHDLKLTRWREPKLSQLCSLRLIHPLRGYGGAFFFPSSRIEAVPSSVSEKQRRRSTCAN